LPIIRYFQKDLNNIIKKINWYPINKMGNTSALSLITLLSPMLQYPGELCVVKHAILDRSLSVHLINFIISEPVNSKIVTIITKEGG
jgi:hypothetical protein